MSQNSHQLFSPSVRDEIVSQDFQKWIRRILKIIKFDTFPIISIKRAMAGAFNWSWQSLLFLLQILCCTNKIKL